MEHDVRTEVAKRGGVLQKVIVTVGTGGIMYLVTALANQPPIWTLTISIFVAGVILVIQFLADFEAHLSQTRRELLQASDIAGLFGRVESSTLSAATLRDILRYSATLGSQPGTASRLVQGELDLLARLMKGLAESGEALYDGEDRDWLLGLVEASGSSIDATSLWAVDGVQRGFVDGGPFWTSGFGLEYLEAQRRAIHRSPSGVRVRRLFVLMEKDRAMLADAGFMRIVAFQRSLGVDVRCLVDDGSFEPINDIVLVDQTVCYELSAARSMQSTPGSTPILHTRLRLGSAYVAEKVRRFEELWAFASPDVGAAPRVPRQSGLLTSGEVPPSSTSQTA